MRRPTGSSLQEAGSTGTMRKFYYAGNARMAMYSSTTTQKFILGDYLGDTMITTNGSGVLGSQTLYYLWGTIRYSYGSIPTTFQFTGQRVEGYLGLYYYGARWYDPAAGRFVQADTIVPGLGNPQSWDRYAYTFNNPVKYTDPTGHITCIFGICIDLGIGSLLGTDADWTGIQTAGEYMNPQSDSIVVAAGIAVQSEWYSPWDLRGFPGTNSGSGLGIAQVSDKQMEEYGLKGFDQTDPNIAIQAMGKRISIVQDACSGCSARDKLIAAALAQNGSGFTKQSMERVVSTYMQKDGSINWAGFFDEPRTPSAYDARLREWITGYQYDTELMLRLYTRDLRELYQRGWKLPEGITEEDLDFMDDLASRGN